MSECGFFLRVNGRWTPIPGVQSGVGIETARPAPRRLCGLHRAQPLNEREGC